MPITTLLSGLPNQSMEQLAFDAAVAKLMTDLPTWGTEANALAAGLNSIAAGGGIALPYTFSTTTTDSDPGAGVVRFNSATQNATTVVRFDNLTGLAQDVSALFDTFDDSTSAIKGHIRLVKLADPTKWTIFSVSSVAAPSGYRNISVTAVLFSTANPFTNGDNLVALFTRNGDKGDTGATGVSGLPNLVVLTSTQAWVVPAGVTKLDVTVVDGGYSGQGTTGNPSFGGVGGQGGAGGTTVVTVVPGISCTATVGAGGASVSSGSPAAGGSTTFAGSGFTTITSANASLKVPGGATGFYADNVRAGNGGGSMLAPPASTGYGAGGKGGYGAASTAGQAGVVIIRY